MLVPHLSILTITVSKVMLKIIVYPNNHLNFVKQNKTRAIHDGYLQVFRNVILVDELHFV